MLRLPMASAENCWRSILPALASAPQKEYRNRRGLSIVTAQSVSSVSPTAYQTPDSTQGGLGVPATNSGHSNVGVTKSNGGFLSRSCRWFGFQSVSGQIQSVRLKANWNINGLLEGDGENEFIFEYSTNNGLSWTTAVFRSNVTAPASGSVDISLSPSQDLTLVQVRDRLIVRPTEGIGFDAHISGAISLIHIEVEMDTTGPVISNVAAGGITTSGATITWNTNENSDGQVVYGTTQAYGQSTTLNPALVTAHSQVLSGLAAGTLYYYRVKSKDAAGNLTTSDEFTFTTAPPPDTTPPVISSVAAGGITTSGAMITWTTNENSDSQVVYGQTTDYGQSTTLNPALVTAHSQGLSGLAAATTYHYRVKSKDAAGNLAVSGDFTFITAQNGSAGIKWLVTDHLGSTRMVIDATGSLAGIKRHDFLPFGEELYAGIGIRSASNGYSDDSARQKFTGKERDDETGLDYFLARYYSNTQGRFTSIDPIIFTSRRGFDPQSLNLYSYVRNNPLKFTDPNGMDWYEKDGQYYWFDKAPKKKLGYHHVNIGPNGLQITNVQGATGQYAGYNGHNITLYNNPGRHIVDNGVYRLQGPPPTDPNAGLRLAARLIAHEAIHAAGHAAGLAGFVFGTALLQQGDTSRITLYRGVSEGSIVPGQYEQALLGNAFPIGGHSDPVLHSAGNTNSIFTSWTTSPAIAKEFATQLESNGVVLQAAFPISRTISPNTRTARQEKEVLVIGPVTGASVRHVSSSGW